MAKPASRSRQVASAVLAAIASLLIALSAVFVYADSEIFEPDKFADRAIASLNQPEVSDAAGRLIAQAIVDNVNSDLIAFQALIQATASGIVNTQAFQSALRSGVSEAYNLALGQNQDGAIVTAANVGFVARAAIQKLDPRIAKQIPEGLTPEMLDLSRTGVGLDLVQLAESAEAAALVLPALAVLALLGAALIDRDRRRGVVRCGIAILVAGLGVCLIVLICGLLATGLGINEGDQDAIAQIWTALFGDLVTWGLVLAVAGTFVAGVAAALVRPVDAEAWIRQGWRTLLRSPERTRWRVIRGAALIGFGLLLITEPGFVSRALIVFAGLGILYIGAAELVRISLPQEFDRTEREQSARIPLRTAGVVTLTGVLLVGLAAFAIGQTTGDDDSISEGPITACNGSAELCDRPFDQVSLAATHNAMSAAEYPNFLFPMHDRTIPRQLNDGVRGLLIDAYYGFPGRTVYTDFDRSPSKLLAQARDEFGEEFVDAANALRAQIAKPNPGEHSKLYLCHGFCELGAIDLLKTFREIDLWLRDNPGEVLAIVIEDYVDPADIVAAANESGLADHVYKGAAGPPWPTLREMIEADQRVVLTAENNAGAAPWYRPAFDLFQETPFEFASLEQMAIGCGPNRGSTDNSLFQINNWINTDPAALPSNAAKANAYDFLLGRARRCQATRGRFPNMIAVDFYRQGDLFDVVDKLNGVDGT